MKRACQFITEAEWKLLDQKIKNFQGHVKSFQKEVEQRLGSS